MRPTHKHRDTPSQSYTINYIYDICALSLDLRNYFTKEEFYGVKSKLIPIKIQK